MRFLLAIAAGIANRFMMLATLNVDTTTTPPTYTTNFFLLGEAISGDVALFLAIALGLAFYALSVLIVRNVFHYGELELRGKNRYITSGGGTFIVVWAMVAVLLNTILR
jgi:hypothetical protein